MANFDREVADRIVKELKRRNVRQVELLTLCKEVGMPISQPDISRIFSGKKTLSLYQCAAVCKALDMPMDFFVWGEEGGREDFCNPHHAESLHDAGKELTCYNGEYYFYYLSTASGEDKILKGRLQIYQKKEFGEICLRINTGLKNHREEWIYKEYSGRILVSTSLGVAYLILKSEKIGEICMLCLRHRNYNIQGMECRIALALTTSAGDAKEPAIHRALLLREGLSDEQAELLRPWLRLTGDNICIEKSQLAMILEEASSRYPEYAQQIARVESYAVPREVVDLSAEVLRRQLPMKRDEFADFLTLLYDKAITFRNYKISASDDLRLYEKVEATRNLEEDNAFYDDA